tara:strand:- start:190 stop:903 length:714 start_codon:yes stop_codon:yes gene_type:complete
MKKLKLILFTFLFLITSSAFSQINSDITNLPYVEVTGTAEMKIVPDEIYISITLYERNENKVKITILEQEEELKKELTNLNIPLTDLSLSDANANYVRVNWTKKDVMAQTEYILKVGDATTIGKVFEKLDGLKIHDANIDRVSHSKMEAYRKEVKIMAIKAAQDKANYLLSAIGSQVVRPLIIKETFSQPVITSRAKNTKYYVNTSNTDFYENKDLETIDFKKITLSASIYIKYEIK